MTEFGKVTGTAKRIAVISSGPSAGDIPEGALKQAADAGVHIIAVNGAMSFVEFCHSWVTIDPSPKNRLLMKNQRPNVTYYAGVPDDYGTRECRFHNYRYAHPNVTYLKRKTSPGLSKSPEKISSLNSGFAGLNLAFLMKPEKIGIFGVDGAGGYAKGNGMPRDLKELPKVFESAVKDMDGIEVRMGSPKSTVRCLEREKAADVLAWLMET